MIQLIKIVGLVLARRRLSSAKMRSVAVNLRTACLAGIAMILSSSVGFSYSNCKTSSWVVPCPWNPALDVKGSSSYCVYRSDAASSSSSSSNGGGAGISGYWGGGGGWGGGSWTSTSSSTDPEVCAPDNPDEEEPCEEPKVTATESDCPKFCNMPKHSESVNSYVDLWGLKYYDSYNDIKVAVPGGWLSTGRTYSAGAWRMDGTNYLAPEAPASGGLQRVSMSGRMFTQVGSGSTTYTSGGYIIEASEVLNDWANSKLLLTSPDGAWSRYRGTVAEGALLEASGFKDITYLFYDYDWASYPAKTLEELRLLTVSSGLESESGSPKVLLDYTYADTDFSKAGKDYPLLTSITSSVGGLSVAYDYNAKGLLERVKKVDGTRSEYTYDDHDNLQTKTEYDSHVAGAVIKACTIDYLPTSLTAADAVETRFMLGAIANGPPKRVASVTNGAGITKSFTGAYNENSGGYYSKVSYSDGRIKEEWYDDKADLIQRSLDGQAVYNRSSIGSVERITTRGNSVEINEYDEFKNRIRTTSPSGHVQSWSYLGQLDRMASHTDARGVVTTYTYDDDLSSSTPYKAEAEAIARYGATRSETTTETSADGSLTRSTYQYYDALERRVLSVNALNHATAYTYKEKTTLITQAKRIDISGGHTLYSQTFDALGHLVTRTDAKGETTTYDYDAVGRLLSMTDALQQTTKYTYLGDDRIESETSITATNSNGRITRYRYDGDGRQTAVIRVDAEGTEHLYQQNTYDTTGRLSQTTNADGLVTTYTYDSYGNRSETSQPLPAARGGIAATHATTTQEWNVYGDLLESTSSAGLTTAYTYDKEGRVLSITEGPGLSGERGVSYRYDAAGNITETNYHLSTGAIETAYNVYDGFGRLTSKSGYGVSPESYTYDLAGNIKTVTNARGLVTEYTYDDFQRVYQIKQIDQDGTHLVATRHYDANGNVIEAINGEGEHQHFAYDALNRQIFQSIPLPSGTSLPANWWTDFDNVALSNTFTRFGQIETTRQAHGQLTTNTYDAFGRLKTITPATGATIEYIYTPADQVARILFPVVSTSAQSLASEIRYTYDPDNPAILVSETTRSGQNVTYTYDAALRRSRVDLPTGAVTGYTFDAFGRLAEQSDYQSEADYDSQTVYRSTQYTAYDDFDRLLTLTLPDNEGTQHSEYDDRGNLLMRYGEEVDDTFGGNTYPVIYGYDELGNLETLITYQAGFDKGSDDENATKSVTTWEYDLRGRLQRKVYADTSDVDYTYYENNRLKTRTNARQQLTTYTYDAWGNPKKIDYAAAGEANIDFVNVKGRRQSMTDANGTTTWAYHPTTGLPASETRTPLVGDPTTVGWAYDEEGRRVQMTVDGLPATHQTGTWQTIYNYDRYGRLQLIQDDRAHSNEPFTYSYASGTGLLEQIDSPWRSGSGTDPYLRQTRSHDNFGRLTDIATLNSTDSVSQSVTGITYDPLNRRTDLSLLGGTLYASQQSRAYAYDNYGQLQKIGEGRLADVDTSVDPTAANYEQYEYDPIGNRLNWWQGDPGSVTPTQYTPDAVNQYASVTPAQSAQYAPSYDADGNLKTDPDWTYTWNTENQLLGMEPITPAEGDQKLSFTYDGLGRRVSKTVETYTSGIWSQTASLSYTYDGWNMIAEVKSPASGLNSLVSYTWGLDLSGSLQGAGGVGGLLAVTESDNSNDAVYMPSYDFNGNVIGYFDTATETLVAEYEYSPFGELVRSTGSKKDEFNFRFSTKYQDAETGLYYYGYRYYDSESGRWLSRDPIGEYGGLNLYGMVGNNAVNFIDTLGLQALPNPSPSPVIPNNIIQFPNQTPSPAVPPAATGALVTAAEGSIVVGAQVGIAVGVTVTTLQEVELMGQREQLTGSTAPLIVQQYVPGARGPRSGPDYFGKPDIAPSLGTAASSKSDEKKEDCDDGYCFRQNEVIDKGALGNANGNCYYTCSDGSSFVIPAQQVWTKCPLKFKKSDLLRFGVSQ